MIEHPHNSSQPLPDEGGLDVSAPPVSAPPVTGSAGPASGGPGSAGSGGGDFGGAHSSPPEPLKHDDPAAEDAAVAHAELPVDELPVDEAAGDEPEPDEVAVVEEEEPERGPIEETPQIDEPPKLNWYILKVQSNREDSIRESLKRRVAVAGLDKYFDEIIVPIEMVSEFKGGKKRVVKRKLYPGYLVVHMEINEETWFLVRETPGIGDFTGSAGKPTPMLPHEVAKIVSKTEEKTDEAPKLKINFNVGDRVKINEGTFDNFEGEVDSIEEASGRVTVMINIFGRSTPVELEYWQIESI
ncbi:MAG: transcription termination/antitermination protein NusG [Pirellulales bacterium]